MASPIVPKLYSPDSRFQYYYVQLHNKAYVLGYSSMYSTTLIYYMLR